jgi:hypothetical protein
VARFDLSRADEDGWRGDNTVVMALEDTIQRMRAEMIKRDVCTTAYIHLLLSILTCI